MEKKQTAVEWLENILHDFIHPKHRALFHPFIEHAKAMEKEQVETAYERGLNFPWALGCEIDNYQEEAKQYYESNYGKQV
jgi:hypothetical protein